MRARGKASQTRVGLPPENTPLYQTADPTLPHYVPLEMVHLLRKVRGRAWTLPRDARPPTAMRVPAPAPAHTRSTRGCQRDVPRATVSRLPFAAAASRSTRPRSSST
jgi:hypothetical protein